MKKLARRAVAAILGYQVRALCKKNPVKVIGVVGSIGKTSTKLAIASTLKAGLRVQYQDGNYNDLVTVPLVFFGEELPNLVNPLAWLMVFWRNQKKLRGTYPYDVVVVELGSDGPGQIEQFKRYLNLEIGVITSISPEHMEFFKDLDDVAKEELAVSGFSGLILANKDLCNDKYLSGISDLLTYGIDKTADFTLSANKEKYAISSGKDLLVDNKVDSLGKAQLYSLLAAAAVAHKLGMAPDDIKKGLNNIKAVPGRMQKLAGINNSTIIDDTYNASPAAMKLALDSLYEVDAPQKIAVLGNMNELGEYSKQAHQEIGNYCDPKQLGQVITIGPDANEYLAAAAETKGCRVERFDSPYKAGEYLKPLIKNNAAVLVKGSQNRVFAEEVIKSLLANPEDSSKLVRQTPSWLRAKQKAFKQ